MRFSAPWSVSVARGKLAEAWRLLRRISAHLPVIGFLPAVMVFLCEASTRRPISHLAHALPIATVKVKPASFRHPVSFRRAGSDLAVFLQMLVRREYAPVAALHDVRLIVDCGANIGLASYYLLHCYPDARLIAVEPDEENYALCRRNLAPFGDRVVALKAAVWPENRPLRIIPDSRRDGSWSLEVEPHDNGDVEGLTMPAILARAGVSGPIDLLKVDIEGAEIELFRPGADWLRSVRNMAIEVHGGQAEAALARALDGYAYQRLNSHELTVFYDLQPPA